MGKRFARFRDGAKWVGHSCTLGRWKMKQLLRRRGSALDPAVEQVATRDGWLPATPLLLAVERRWEKHVGWAAVQELFASCQLVQQGDLKLVWRWSQGPSCESRRRVLVRQKSLCHSCQQLWEQRLWTHHNLYSPPCQGNNCRVSITDLHKTRAIFSQCR